MSKGKRTFTVIAKKCREMTEAGLPCPAPAQKGLDVCMWHDPAKAVDRLVAQKLGGKLSRMVGRHMKPSVPIQSPADLLAALGGAIADCAMMPVNAHRASSIAVLSREWRETFLLNEANEGRLVDVTA